MRRREGANNGYCCRRPISPIGSAAFESQAHKHVVGLLPVSGPVFEFLPPSRCKPSKEFFFCCPLSAPGLVTHVSAVVVLGFAVS